MISNGMDVPEKPIVSDAISWTANLCGGDLRELSAGVIPENSNDELSKLIQDGSGVLS